MKKMFKLSLYVLLICVASILSGCNGRISTYGIPVSQLPQNLDAQVATRPEEILTLTNIFDGLYEFVDGEIIPNVAQSCDISSDGRIYTFTLKQTSFFYKKKNGSIPVTAKDFAFSFNRILNAETKSPYYEEFKNIENVQVIDAYTLQIKLSKPDQNFLDKLCLTAATPCNEEFFKSTNGAYGLGVPNVLSNGPFTINYIAADDSYANLVRTVENKGAVDRIRLYHTDESDIESELFASDKITGFFQFDNAAQSVEGINKSFESAGINLIFNMENDALKNENIRKALAYYAFSLENSGANLVAVEQNFSIFSDHLTFNGKAINEQIFPKKPDYMSQNAKQLCQQGLLEINSTKLSGIRVLVPSDSIYSIVFENINQLWQKELGQFFSLEFIPTQEIIERIAEQDFEIAFVGVSPKVNSPFSVLDEYSKYDGEIKAFTDSAHRNTGNQNMLDDIEKAQNIVLDKAYIVPTCKSKTSYWHKKEFEGIGINPFGNILNLKYAKVK